jgi:hypothetical protein
MNPWKRHEIGLELIQINVEGTIETQARGNRANNLGDKSVEVLIPRARDIQVALTDTKDSLIVDEESAFRVLNSAMCGQNGIVGFYHSSSHAGRRVDNELQLRLLAILSRKTL